MSNKLSTLDLYNQAYANLTPDFMASDQLDQYLEENSKSILSFVKSYLQQAKSLDWPIGRDVLEAGCGLGGVSHFFAAKAKSITAIDLSPLAIMNAKTLAAQKKFEIDFIVDDLTQSKSMAQKYDLIIDSHLLHCLTSDEERLSYLAFVKNSLKPQGIFLCETSCFNEQFEEPIDYDLDENYTLFKKIDEKIVPVRKIQPSIKLEEEFKQAGLELNYFYYHNELAFNIFPEYPRYPDFRLPRTIRLGAQLPSA